MFKKCAWCKKEFEVTEQEKRFCSLECRKILAKYHKKYNIKYNKSHKKELKEKRDKISQTPEYKALRKRIKLMERYKITEEQFNQMLIQQNNRCAICETTFKNRTDTHVDHDHITNKVRGLLCLKCNFGIGAFKENIKALRNSIIYLTKGD